MGKQHYKYFTLQVNQSADYFQKWFHKTEELEFNEEGDILGNSLYCDIHDVFIEYHAEKSGKPDIYAHNCIGCNLDESALNIKYFLNTNRECGYVQYFLALYSLLFYTHAERLGVIYNEIGFSKVKNGKSQFDWDSFPNLQMIKNWANFFKHPKAYMFLHHPGYHIVSDPNKPNFLLDAIIDNDFIQKFYRAGADNTLLKELLENKEDVKVFFPDLLETTMLLCSEFEKIITVIKNDKDIVEKLDCFTIPEDYSDYK